MDEEFVTEGRDEALPQQPLTGKAKIKVIGVGGAGNNAVNRMIEAGIVNAEFIAVNTDAQALAGNRAPTKIQIGPALTKGLGAGADPEIGKQAAEESKEELTKAIEKADLLFIAAGMGGGTGTGAAPVIAKIARDLKILTVAVVTKPFDFEGKHKMEFAMRGIKQLSDYVDTIVTIPNERINAVVPAKTPIKEAFRIADDVLKQGIRGITDLIATPALINLDFADVRTVLKDKGIAHMGVGVARGENRIVDAVRLAVNSPLLDTTIEGANSLILNVTGGEDLTLSEVNFASRLIKKVLDPDANIIFGACVDESITEEVEVTVIATWNTKNTKEGQKANPSPLGAYTESRFRDEDSAAVDILLHAVKDPAAGEERRVNYTPAPGYPYAPSGEKPVQPVQPVQPERPVAPAPAPDREEPAQPAHSSPFFTRFKKK